MPSRIFIAKHLKYYERLFQDLPFLFRVHRGHMVNLYYVKKLLREDGGLLAVAPHDGGPDVQIPVSPSLREELLIRLKNL